MEKVDLQDDELTVIVDYAHTPDALSNVLDAVCNCKEADQRLVCIFGCGGDRDKTKRPVMGRISTERADHTIVTSDNSRTEDPMAIISDILAGIDADADYQVIPDRRTALEQAVINAQKNDIILVARKGHEDYEITKEGKRPFSEKKIIKEAYEKRMRREPKQ
jgi:UDP-N-acetylmuramoyl-L-alanyl-D-glutamate--2,6-diaminopimelate ligase